MVKLTYENKINLYEDYKKEITITSLSKKYIKRISGINYLIKLIDKHRFDNFLISTNKLYPKFF